MVFGRRKNGETVYSRQDGEDAGSGVWQARMDGLTPGLEYDLVAIAVNVYGLESETNPTLSAQLAPGDGAAPGVPSGLSVTGNVGNCSLDWSDNSEDDFARYVVYRNDVKIAEVDVSRFVDATGLTMGTSYTYKVSAQGSDGERKREERGRGGDSQEGRDGGYRRWGRWDHADCERGHYNGENREPPGHQCAHRQRDHRKREDCEFVRGQNHGRDHHREHRDFGGKHTYYGGGRGYYNDAGCQ